MTSISLSSQFRSLGLCDGLVRATGAQGYQEPTPVQAAVNLLISNGVYTQILTKWGLQAGAVTTATVNGASS